MKKAGEFWVPDSETIQLEALAAGGWQLERLEMAFRYVKNWDLAIDGGAHVGSWTLAMARRFKSVRAFEPCPETFQCLDRNCLEMRTDDTAERPERACDVMLYPAALGAEPGRVGMAEDGKYSNGGNTGGRYISGQGEIPVVTLDSLHFENVGLIKLDLEGYEYFALKGAVNTLRTFKPVVLIEDKIRMAHRYSLQPHKACAFLNELGMREAEKIGSDRVFVW